MELWRRWFPLHEQLQVATLWHSAQSNAVGLQVLQLVQLDNSSPPRHHFLPVVAFQVAQAGAPNAYMATQTLVVTVVVPGVCMYAQ